MTGVSTRVVMLSAGLAMSASMVGLCGQARAMPPIMDRVSAEAALAIVIPNPDQLSKDLGGLAQLVGMPGDAVTIDAVTRDLGINLEKLGKIGAVAMILPEAPKEGEAEPVAIALVEVEDYAKVQEALKLTADGAVEKADIDGETVFFKKIDAKLAAISSNKEALAAFKADAGQSDAHKRNLGKRAGSLTDKSDLAIVFNMNKMRPEIEKGIKELEGQMEEMAAMGGQAPNTAVVKFLQTQVLSDVVGAVAIMSVDSMGISLDLVGNMKEGSRMAKLTSATGKATSLLNKVPGGAYLLASALDLSDPELRKFLMEIPAGAGPEAALTNATNKAMFEQSTGAASVIGVNPGGIMAGLLARTVSYTQTSNPSAAMNVMKTDFAKAMTDSKMGTYDFKDDAAEVGGKKVASYEITFAPNEDAGMMGQAMMFMFGPAGAPAGYIAPVDGGVISTMSKSSDLMEMAMAAAKGEKSLGGDKVLAAVGEKLPPNRTAEIYLGAKGLVDTALPAVAMFTGMPIKVDVPDRTPPIGAALAPAEGALQATIYIPADTLKMFGDVGKAFQAAQQKQMEQEEQPAEPMDGGNKPKF
jgi:hypothetical protein